MLKVCLTKLFRPQAEKQIPAGPPPSYDEMIKELGDDPPPEYEEDDSPDYALAPGDEAEAESSETEEANKLLGSLNIRSYDTVDATLAYSKLSATQRRKLSGETRSSRSNL